MKIIDQEKCFLKPKSLIYILVGQTFLCGANFLKIKSTKCFSKKGPWFFHFKRGFPRKGYGLFSSKK
jgi:hypothetical protein